MPTNRRRGLLPVDFRFEEHRGKWIVLVNDAVVESGTDLNSCLARARTKHPDQEPFVMKVLLPGAPSSPHPPGRRDS